jgi:hypothetical protein
MWIVALCVAMVFHTALTPITVDPIGTDTADCGSMRSPCQTLTHAVGVAAPDGQIYLNEGLYQGECSPIGLLVNKSIVIIGKESVIDCEGKGRALSVSNLERGSKSVILTLVNVTIINGHYRDECTFCTTESELSSGGSAVHVSAKCSLVLRGCHFKNHAVTNLLAGSSSVRGGGAIFVDLSAGETLGIYLSMFTNCSTSEGYGGGLCVRLETSPTSMSMTRKTPTRIRVEDTKFIACAARRHRIRNCHGVVTPHTDGTSIGGGGMAVSVDDDSQAANVEMDMSRVSFSHCACGDAGGGGLFWNLGAGISKLRLVMCTFFDNIATGGGEEHVFLMSVTILRVIWHLYRSTHVSSRATELLLVMMMMMIPQALHLEEGCTLEDIAIAQIPKR